MSITIGTDVADVAALERRIQRSENDFAARFCTPSELADCAGRFDRLAGRWAAKEATMKALGVGIGPLDPLEIEVKPDGAALTVVLHRRAADRAQELGIDTWFLSLSLRSKLAMAVVIGTRKDTANG